MPTEKSPYTIKYILATAVWILLGAGTIVLLAAAINKKNGKHCKAVKINISGVENNFFIDKKDVAKILERMNMVKLEGKPASSIDLAKMESVLEKNDWIKKAELFFDNNEVLEVNITEREPVARIFTAGGETFYIDTSLTRLPLSDKLSARLPVFTNFPSDQVVLSKDDSMLLSGIRNLSWYILKDPFWMAQVDQVNITDNRNFEMIPKIGNQVIVFGNAENYKEKFNKLLVFYKQVQSRIGWNKYSKIDVQFKGQVVAVKRDASDIKMDSLKAKELMKMLVANAQKLANDSANNIQLIQQQDDNNTSITPLQDEEPLSEHNGPVRATINDNKPPAVVIAQPRVPVNTVKPAVSNVNIVSKPAPAMKKPATHILRPSSNERPNPIPAKKPVVTKPKGSVPVVKPTTKPKAVMPPKNDY